MENITLGGTIKALLYAVSVLFLSGLTAYLGMFIVAGPIVSSVNSLLGIKCIWCFITIGYWVSILISILIFLFSVLFFAKFLKGKSFFKF